MAQDARAGNATPSAADGGIYSVAAQRPAPDYFERNGWPDPGWPYSSRPALLTGLFAVACAQLAVIAYHYIHLRTRSPRIQKAAAVPSSFWRDAAGHLAQPEGFLLLGSYLAGSWMFRIMPESYYSGDGGVNLVHVFLQVQGSLASYVWSCMLSPQARGSTAFSVLTCALCPIAVGHPGFRADDNAPGRAQSLAIHLQGASPVLDSHKLVCHCAVLGWLTLR